MDAVRNYLTSVFPEYNKAGIKAWISYTPVEAMPWYLVMSWINDACRLPEVITALEARTQLQCTGDYYSVNGATRFFAYCTLLLADYIMSRLIFEQFWVHQIN